jgi:hypothetical protein
MMGIGNKVNHILKVYILGQMVDLMMESIIWEKNKDMANINFKMEKYMKDNGKMENNMGKVN